MYTKFGRIDILEFHKGNSRIKEAANMRVKILALLLLGMIISAPAANAADAQTIMDGFYSGLADIIENNMDSPERCVAEVDRYYEANKATIEEMRRLTEEAMAQVAPQAMKIMDDYESMSEEELAELEKRAERSRMAPAVKISPGAARYSEVVRQFTQRHPQHGIKIAMKAMEFLPKGR